MVIDLIQTKANYEKEFIFFHNNIKIYDAIIEKKIGVFKAVLQKDSMQILKLNHKKLPIFYNFNKKNLQKKWNVFEIKDANGNYIGEISQKRLGFFGGYTYYEILYNGERYNCYEVGLGKKGTFICIYLKDKQIGLIEKETITNNNKDNYHIYLIDNNYLVILCIVALHYDHIKFGNYGEVAYAKKQVSYHYTLNKELKSKYKEEFKLLC